MSHSTPSANSTVNALEACTMRCTGGAGSSCNIAAAVATRPVMVNALAVKTAAV